MISQQLYCWIRLINLDQIRVHKRLAEEISSPYRKTNYISLCVFPDMSEEFLLLLE